LRKENERDAIRGSQSLRDELSDQETQDVIKGVTDVIVSVSGEALRPHTWVVVTQVRSGSWGVGGNPLGLKDIRGLQGRSD
jgi:4-oxalocrotonate tautomerase